MNFRRLLIWSEGRIQWGLLILRLGIGISFIIHGLPKLTGGIGKWERLGGAMSNIGINFLPTLWGFLAAAAEGIGGLFLVLGFMTRLSASAMAFTMFIAMLLHINNGDPFSKVSHPLELMLVFIFLAITGAGRYSLDSRL